MKLFMIGATGYIGSVVAERLQADGHELIGLARSDEAAAQLTEAGIVSVRGALGDVDVITEQAAKADGVVQISTGGFMRQALDSVDRLLQTTDAIIDALAGTNKPYLFTYGIAMWLDTGFLDLKRVVTEADPVSWPYFYAHLGAIQRKLDADPRVRSIGIAPGAVYGRGGGYINPISRLFDSVRKHGVVYAISDSEAGGGAVHVDDLADLYALALKSPQTKGLFIGSSENGEVVDIAKAVSTAAGLGGKLEFVEARTLRKLNGRYAEMDFWTNLRVSGQKARDVLGWRPHRPSLIEELTSLPRPLDLNSVYPQPQRSKASAAAKVAAGKLVV